MRAFSKTSEQAFLNFLLAKYEMYTGAIEVRSQPYFLAIDPSSICQLRCPTCPTGIDNAQHKDRTGLPVHRKGRTAMGRDRFDALLDELGEKLFHIFFYNWGEPLLNPDLASYVRRAGEYEIETDVHTNLSLRIRDETIDELLSAGLGTLSASIDGFSQETYEQYRVGGRLDLVKENLERIVSARDRIGTDTTIEWNLLVFQFNEHEVPAAREYCKKLGIQFNTRDGYIDHPEWLPEHRKKEVPVSEDYEWKGTTLWAPVSQKTKRGDATGCAWHYGYSIVNADGSVSPCCASWNQKDDFGTVVPGEVQFADVWNNKHTRASRASFAHAEIPELEGVETLCTRCPHPKSIQHLYSLLDVKVFLQLHRALGGRNALLEGTAHLLARARYGRLMAWLLRRGWGAQLMLLLRGREDLDAMSRFVGFFEAHLLDGAATSERANGPRK